MAQWLKTTEVANELPQKNFTYPHAVQFVVSSRKMTELLQHRQVSDVVDVVVVDSEDTQSFLGVKIIVKLLVTVKHITFGWAAKFNRNMIKNIFIINLHWCITICHEPNLISSEFLINLFQNIYTINLLR